MQVARVQGICKASSHGGVERDSHDIEGSLHGPTQLLERESGASPADIYRDAVEIGCCDDCGIAMVLKERQRIRNGLIRS